MYIGLTLFIPLVIFLLWRLFIANPFDTVRWEILLPVIMSTIWGAAIISIDD